ncbi:MAG: hypothetical protein CL678_00630 [Bdellovibrionaceae bacterium]|nr:hypothetical protein [Pseudobdellovibrionaceae bacterium]|tara:strand:+ start:1745 stop:2149 length:405 start_codon:yes stop_codon:yes gene_type:complete
MNNEANDANFTEIRGHLDLIRAKLSNASTAEARSALIESQEDYYERALQLRIMQNQTQAELLTEEKQACSKLQNQLRRTRNRMAVLIFLTLLFLVEYTMPGLARYAIKSQWLQLAISHTSVACAAYVLIIMCKK